jgi:cytochrome c-type biogenesis protein CcmH/NrfG
MESKKVQFFNKLSFVILFATVFGSLFFFIPYVSVTLEASKGFLLSVGVTLALFFWLIARLGEGKFIVPKDRLILFAGIIPFVFFVASLFSSSLYISLFGHGFEIGTFGSMLVLFVLFFLSSMYFQTEKRLWYFFGGLFGAAIILAVFELINLFLGFGKLPGLLNGVSNGNLVGTWNNFALVFGLIVLLCAFTLEFLNTRKLFTVVQYCLLVVSLFFLIILNIPFVWLLVGLFSLVFAVYTISLKRTSVAVNTTQGDNKKFPFASLLIFFVCLIFLVGSNSIGALISRHINVANTDVRPSLVATGEVAYKAIRHNPFFGTGPNTFVNDWALWQPKAIAQTPYWNVDFENGIGLIPTFLITTGVVGFAAFLLFIIVFLMRSIQSLRIAVQNPLANYFIVTTFMISLYSWISLVFYSPNVVMLILAFASSGALVSILVYKKAVPVSEFSFLADPRQSFFVILGLIVVMIAAISTTYVYAEKFASVIYFSKSLNPQSNLDSLSRSERMLNNALVLDKNDIYYRTLSQVYIGEIGVLVNDKNISQDRLKTSVQQLVNAASTSAGLAVTQNPKQYLNYMNLGNVYSSLVPLSVVNSYESAVTAYTKAQELAPNNPAVILARASLEYVHKDTDQAKKYISQAIALKPDYTDAMFLLAQIYVDQGQTSDAIKEAQTASQASPNDPTVFFRLGLLEYNNSNYSDAVGSFETAVSLDPTYVNARYYYGQALKKVGRSADALAQFKILDQLVPNNKDIQDELNGTASTPTTPVIPSTSTATPQSSTSGATTPVKNDTTKKQKQ